MKTLFLTLHKKAFDVMVIGEKTDEYRKRSQWMLSRLFDQKTLIEKKYSHIHFTHGYGSDKPYFIVELKFWKYARHMCSIGYSNGLSVVIEQGDIIFRLGKIIETGNLINK